LAQASGIVPPPRHDLGIRYCSLYVLQMKFFHYASYFLFFVWLVEVPALEIQNPVQPSYRAHRVSPALGLISVNLKTWGAKDVAHNADEPLSMTRPSEHILDFKDKIDGQILQRAHAFYSKGTSHFRLLTCSVMLALLLLGLLFAPRIRSWIGSDNDTSELTAETHPDLAAVVEIGEGTWAHTYRNANAEQKDALELLFRCKIVSLEEFAHSHASQEHIDECVWIAKFMLIQKPLEEWVACRQQALQSFEDSITAIFAARTAQNGKDMPWSARGKAEESEVPPTPPLQGCLKDLLILKGGFPSPVPRKILSNASTVQASPAATPGRLSQSLPFNQADLDLTFDKQMFYPEDMNLTFGKPLQHPESPFSTVPHVNFLPPSMRELGTPGKFRPAPNLFS